MLKGITNRHTDIVRIGTVGSQDNRPVSTVVKKPQQSSRDIHNTYIRLLNVM